MQILITGGAGFVGSHLCERLVQEGHEVYSLDNYFTGSRRNHVTGVEYIFGHTADIFKLIRFIPDMVYHLGEYSRVEQSFDDMELVLEYNKTGTHQVLEFVRANNSKLIYAGSSTKFGDNGQDSSPYAWSKATNTQLVKNYGDWFNIDYCISYFYNVYGPREISSGKYATLIAKFNKLCETGQVLTVVSPGSQIRNFTHIDDTIDALLLIGEKGSMDEYPIGNPKGYSVLEIANMFGADVEMLPERKGNRMVADVNTETTRALGWEPKRDLKDYINNLKIGHQNNMKEVA